MLSSETVAEKIFKILKGNGHDIQMFTDEGATTVDPSEGRRFFINQTGTMVSLDETDNNREIKVSIGANTDIDVLKDTLHQVKKLANSSIIEYTLKSYTKSIEPKDFDYQAQKVRDMNQVNEAIGQAYGSTKSSYQKLESARLIIKHTKPVNEEQRGSRSRNISAIYIENADGERYKFPSNNLAGGRAMLRHVKEGGTPYDDFGKHIVEQCIELKKLKEFKRYSEKNNLVNEDTADIVEAVVGRINSIREGLNKLKGSKTYALALEAFSNNGEQLDEDDYADIKDKFTVSYFDENVEGALPYVQALVKEMQFVREQRAAVEEAVVSLLSMVESKDAFGLREGTDLTADPENPMRAKMESARSQLGAVMEYIANVLDESEQELATKLQEASKLVDSIQDDAMLGKSAKAITMLMPKLSVVEKQEVRSEAVDWEQDLEKKLENYDLDKLFN
jgi:hypothetical protein